MTPLPIQHLRPFLADRRSVRQRAMQAVGDLAFPLADRARQMACQVVVHVSDIAAELFGYAFKIEPSLSSAPAQVMKRIAAIDEIAYGFETG